MEREKKNKPFFLQKCFLKCYEPLAYENHISQTGFFFFLVPLKRDYPS